jgi:hypothetical protein
MELIRISFGKDHYHLQREMVDWCEKNLGTGGYYSFTRNPKTAKWAIESMFGSTHFFFRDSKDAVLFGLTWR